MSFLENINPRYDILLYLNIYDLLLEEKNAKMLQKKKNNQIYLLQKVKATYLKNNNY